MTKQMIVQNTSLLLDVDKFAHAQRVGNMLIASTMVPEHFRNNLGNCVIALNYADRVGLDPFMAMQKMYVIKGKPAIETQLQIALFNKSNSYSNLKYRMSGEGDSRQCVAYAMELESKEEVEGPPVSIDMAKKEGWHGKGGSKWKTMPEVMLRYRAAAFFIRLYAPETTLGLSTTEEMVDMDEIKNVTPTAEIKIQEEANQGEVIDIDSSNDVKEPETSLQEQENGGEMTEEEKAEITRQEAEAAKEEEPARGPGF